MVKCRSRHKQTTSLQDRLARFSREVRERAVGLPPGEEREALMKKLELTQQAVQIIERLDSPLESGRRELRSSWLAAA